jgi:hypothetical protein
MKNHVLSMSLRSMVVLSVIGLQACTVTPEGAGPRTLPAAVQGSNDAQGSPLSVPGSGMGVGSGNPGSAQTGNAAGR